MSPQGDRHSAGADDWWDKLYDDTAPDTAPAATGDTLDDRFDSASGTFAPGHAPPPYRPPSPWEAAPPPGPRTFPGGSHPPAVEQAPPEGPAPRPRGVPGARPGGAPPRSAGEGSAAPEGPAPRRDPRAVPRPDTGPGGDSRTTAPDRAGTGADTPSGTDSEPRPATGPASHSRTGPDPRSGADSEAAAPAASAPGPVSGFDPGPAPGTASGFEPGPGPVPQRQSGGRTLPRMRFAKALRPDDGSTRSPVPAAPAEDAVPPRRASYVGDGPPTYEAEPTALPQAWPHELDEAAPDTVLEGARYGAFTLRAASVRGDSARYRGESRRDALLAARFGTGDGALVLVAVATGARAVDGAHVAARDACRWIGEAVGRSHARLADDIRAGRREDLKSGLHRLTDRAYGRLRARAAELGFPHDAYTADLRCLLLPADADCRNRIFFGVGPGGLFRLRGGAWQDLEPPAPEPGAVTGAPVVGYGSPPPGADTAATGNPAAAGDPAATRSGAAGAEQVQDAPLPETDGRTMRLGVTPHPGAPYIEGPLPPPAVPFRFRASIARPGTPCSWRAPAWRSRCAASPHSRPSWPPAGRLPDRGGNRPASPRSSPTPNCG